MNSIVWVVALSGCLSGVRLQAIFEKGSENDTKNISEKYTIVLSVFGMEIDIDSLVCDIFGLNRAENIEYATRNGNDVGGEI